MTIVPNFLSKNASQQDFDLLTISIASSDDILKWSYGEVKKPETINYRTFKPERDGLFCAKIFGPIKDYECLCGKYKRMKYRGIVCEKCGVEVIQQIVRRDRMGHIALATPVVHVWFLKSIPSKIGMFIDISSKELERVLYYEKYIVIDPGVSHFSLYQVISEEQYREGLNLFTSDGFKASMGAEAIKSILSGIDLKLEEQKLKLALQETTSELKFKKIIKKLKTISAMIESNIRPEWMVIDVLPVLPPDLRPLVPLDGGRFATSDLNDLYRRVINRNNRLKKLIELGAPEIIILNEKRMLQEAVDALFDNTKRVNPIKDGNNRALKSFAEIIKGKQGRFRQNLLGKRVDYSGRSVITVGPYLKLHECGVPKKMALELFKPFIYSKLQLRGIASTIKIAKKIVADESPEVWDILEEVVKDHPVLLNRAPTLHRLGIQAFEPKIIEGNAIHLHPLVCTAFNADFDGDQMAIHIPLSLEAQIEARVLMMSSNNILSPANGKPIIVPSQDIVLGLYYLSLIDNNIDDQDIKLVSSMDELELLLYNKLVSLHTKVKYQINADIVVTTPGRLLLYAYLPKNDAVDFTLIDKILSKKEITKLIDIVYRVCGKEDTVVFVDHLMQLGFKTACNAGISIGKDDLIIPDNKFDLIDDTHEKVALYNQQYQDGLITDGERYNKIISIWTECSDKIANEMMSYISSYNKIDDINSVYMMMDSGARGSVSQLRQLSGMRGLMAKPTGEIIEFPILSNFKEGLNVLEYFSSTHGARKGLADTALKTANAGYLTRRLVDVAQDMIIVNEDCGSTEGIIFSVQIEGGKILHTLGDQILGRFLAEDLIDIKTGEMILPQQTYIDESLVDIVNDSNVNHVKVRSPLFCVEKRGLCRKCYGRDISRGEMVHLGEAVGVIAAQSIGEPGTQLTMRTFHVGGVAQQSTEKNSLEATISGVVRLINARVITNSNNIQIILSRSAELSLLDHLGQEIFKEKIPYGAKLYVQDGDNIEVGVKIAEWDPFTIPIITEYSGIIEYFDLIDGVSLSSKVDEGTGISSKVVLNWRQNAQVMDIKPMMVLNLSKHDSESKSEMSYLLQPNTIIFANSGDHVNVGDVIAVIPKDSVKTKDITGGLPRVIELFEARKPKEIAVIADIDGIVEYAQDSRNKKVIYVYSQHDPDTKYEYVIPKDRQLLVYDGDVVSKGEQLTDGVIVPHDILRVQGINEFASYMIKEVQSVYSLQGVLIDNKHIEVIVHQMIQKVEVVNIGDSNYFVGDILDRLEVLSINEDLIANGLKPIKYNIILQAITRASLQTKSFISAASFQETTKILTDSALIGRKDYLEGLKENIIIGRLIPVGTGYLTKQYQSIDDQE